MTDNSGDKNNWREKYLNALDEQEQLEKKFASQQDLLRSALVRVSVAADGQDETLDLIMNKLREQLRGNMSAIDFNSTLAQLESAALAFEQQREQSAQDIRQALIDTTKPLQTLKLSRNVKKELNDYLTQLPQRSKKVRLYPALLQQLANIQQQALSEIEQPKTGLFDKILGSKTSTKKDEPRNESEESLIANIPPMIDFPVARVAPHENHLTAEYSAQIIRVLSQFFTSLEHEATIKNKVEAMHRKLEQGVSVDSLIPLIDSVRDLVMEAYLAANQAFATYLKNVNQELAEIYMLLGGAVKNTQN